MKKFALVLMLLFAYLAGKSQDFDQQKMDSLFTLIEKKNKGMNSVSIFKEGKEVYQKSIGYADINNSIKASNKTKYRIGSISKTFTAAIIMKLIENNQLTLDTKLSGFFPQIKNAKEITIEQLLRHQSGIYNFTNASDYVSWMESPITKEALVEKIKNYGSSFKPGSKSDYSNAGYVLLSYIAEKITKQEFSTILDSLICKPCLLTDTYYGGKINSDNNEAYSYQKTTEWALATETDMSVPVGAGAVVSNPTDLNKFLTCLHQNKVLSASSLKAMMTIKDGYGIGMFQVPFYEKKSYGHTGGIDGFVSSASYFPEENVSIAFTSNGLVMPMNDILIGLLSIYFNKAYQLPEFKNPITLKPEELTPYLGTYSSPAFPLKLTITKKGNKLFGQGTGQSEFPLDAYGNNTFKYDAARLEIVFYPKENKLQFDQGRGKIELTKE